MHYDMAFEQLQGCASAWSKAVLHGLRYSTCFVMKDLSMSLSAAIASLHLGSPPTTTSSIDLDGMSVIYAASSE
jgi:hypothetical protein